MAVRFHNVADNTLKTRLEPEELIALKQLALDRRTSMQKIVVGLIRTLLKKAEVRKTA